MDATLPPAFVTDLAPPYALEIEGLCKTYPGTGGQEPLDALKDVSLRVPRGSIFGLLGPNGAGKSTLINILAGLVLKTRGTARIWGHEVSQEPRAASCAIGVVPQELNLDAFFTPREVLEQMAGFYGVPRSERKTDELLELVELKAHAHKSARSLSGGMRRRLMMAKAMVHHPPVLVLDEPTAGVDVELRHALWQNVRRLNERGTTILLTTHYLEEAQELCDTIAIIDHGHIIACDKQEALLKQYGRKTLSVTLARGLDELPAMLAKQGWVLEAPERLSLTYRPCETRIGQELLTIQALGYSITDLTTKEKDLEDIFLEFTARDRAVA